MKHLLLNTCATLIFASALLEGCSSSTDPSASHLSGKRSVMGVVKTVAGDPLSGVAISLSRPDSVSTATDSYGAFHFDSIPVGQYTIYARKAGFTDNFIDVRIDSGADANLSITMSTRPAFANSIVVHVLSGVTGLSFPGAKVYAYANVLLDSSLTDSYGIATLSFNNTGLIKIVGRATGYQDGYDSTYINAGQQGKAVIHLSK